MLFTDNSIIGNLAKELCDLIYQSVSQASILFFIELEQPFSIRHRKTRTITGIGNKLDELPPPLERSSYSSAHIRKTSHITPQWIASLFAEPYLRAARCVRASRGFQFSKLEKLTVNLFDAVNTLLHRIGI